jgi:hypothetical protein
MEQLSDYTRIRINRNRDINFPEECLLCNKKGADSSICFSASISDKLGIFIDSSYKVDFPIHKDCSLLFRKTNLLKYFYYIATFSLLIALNFIVALPKLVFIFLGLLIILLGKPIFKKFSPIFLELHKEEIDFIFKNKSYAGSFRKINPTGTEVSKK